MILACFTIHDSKAEAYMQPFFFPTRGLAIRTFTDMANDSQSNIGRYPEDYTLFEIGHYDDQNATFQNHLTPVAVIKALDLVKES